jgi:hypothetical protein
MRLFRFLFAVACAGVPSAMARAADPITVALNERASVGGCLVTLGDVALISGGDAATRARIAAIDLLELKLREPSAAVGRRAVEYRLLLAGFDAPAVRLSGAERSTVTLSTRSVTVEEVLAVARTELLRQSPNPDSVALELAVPIVLKMPEVPANERVTITAKQHAKSPGAGRVQMDVTISARGESLLAFAVHFTVQPQAPGAVVPAAGFVPQVPAASLPPLPTIPPLPPAQSGARPVPGAMPATGGGEVLIRARQRVEMQVNSGGLKVSTFGEAQQAGKLGETIMVQNVDSKKTISARVTGPGTVEVDLGGSR